MEKIKIYLVENCFGDKNKIYIGKTFSSRKKIHKKIFGNQISYTYIDESNSNKLKDWVRLEKYWIEQFSTWGFDIQNINKGEGEMEFVTKKIKNKINKSTLGNTNKKGYITPPEVKEKISNSLKGRTLNEQQRKKLRVPKKNKENFGKHRIGIEVSLETREKRSKSNPNKKPVIQYNKNMEFIKEFIGVREAARQTGCYDSSITMCCKGRLKTTKGFKFKYK